MSAAQFDYFSKNLLSDYDFLLTNIDCMYQDGDGVSHCLLVLGEGRDDGIIVNSEGSAYARYSAFVPNARQLWQRQMAYDPILTEFCEKMQSAADGIVKDALQHHQDGMYRVLTDNVNLNLGNLPGSMEFLYEMLRNRPELAATEDFHNEIVLQLKPEYLPAEEKEYRRISQEQVDIMCAKHTLWLHDEGGVQADFSGCELSNLDLSHRDLNNALFNGAFLYGTSFQESYLCFADFSDAEIENCNAKNIAADEAVFKNAVIRNCDFSGAFIQMGIGAEDGEDESVEIQIRIAEIDREFKEILSSVTAENQQQLLTDSRITELMTEKRKLESRLAEYAAAEQHRKNTASRLDQIFTILDGMKNHPLTYGDQVIRQILRCVVVESKEKIRVVFIGGLEVEAEVEY